MNWKDKFPKENIYFQTDKGILYNGDVLEQLKQLPDESIDCIITSPPYWNLRDYGVEGQIGLEPILEEYLEKLLAVASELKRVLKKTGVIFWNHGDCYGGNGREKCMVLQNYRFVTRCVDELGLILRDIIIWAKKVWIARENITMGNAMPSCLDPETEIYIKTNDGIINVCKLKVLSFAGGKTPSVKEGMKARR